MMTSLFNNPWFLALRPKTLTAALVPIGLASFLAHHEGFAVSKLVLFAALWSSFLIQIATNLFNDAIDFEKGADTKDRIGPTRITQSGQASARQVYLAAGACLFGALLGGIYLVAQGGWPIVLIGSCSLFLAYSYTGGPFPLAYLGLGDLFVILFFGVIAVMGLYFIYSLEWSLPALVLGLQAGFLATVLIAINNLRDWQGDKKVGKKTIPVRFGESVAKYEIYFLILAPFVFQIYWVQFLSRSYWAALPLLALPLALKVLNDIRTTAPSEKYNKYLAQAAGLHLLFGLLLMVGLYND